MADYPMACDTCGTIGTEDDGIEIGGECAHDWCEGTIIHNGPDETYAITVKVGPHPAAKEFAQYLLGEVEYRIMNEKEEAFSGIPVEFGMLKEPVS